MKKIINGLRYDTETSIEIGRHCNMATGMNDFSHWDAALYKTPRSGKFFLAGEGHGMTIFASHNGDSSGWGSRIIPMSKEEALEWAEMYLDEDEIEAHFADTIKDA